MTLTNGAFLNQKHNKQTSHELHRTILLAALFHMVHQVEKTVNNITRWHKTLSASAISKQVSRRCINSPHELTCQILTNQSLKIGHRAWSTREYCEKSKAIAFPACKSQLSFRVRDQFEIKILKVQLMNATYCVCISKKIELEPAIIWKVATCRQITLKKHSNSVSRYLSRWYWSADTLFWQLSSNQNMDEQDQVIGSQTS